MKTRLDILTDIEDELNARIPVNIYPSDVNLNDKWYSEKEIREVMNKLIEDEKLDIYNKILIELLDEDKTK